MPDFMSTFESSLAVYHVGAASRVLRCPVAHLISVHGELLSDWRWFNRMACYPRMFNDKLGAIAVPVVNFNRSAERRRGFISSIQKTGCQVKPLSPLTGQ
jgi:hypothetical protein